MTDDNRIDPGSPGAEATPPADRARLGTTHAVDERRLLEEAQREIREAFPWLPAERVDVVVECLWAQYDDARIRDFIPVLVRRQAREELRDHFHTEALDATPPARWMYGASA